MLQEVYNRLNEEGFKPRFNDDEDEISIVIDMSNSDELDEEELEDISSADDVEAILDEYIEDGEPITYFYDSYDRADGVTVETINITLN